MFPEAFAAFLYPLKTLENVTVFWCFHGIEKRCIGNEWANKVANCKLEACNFTNAVPVQVSSCKFCKIFKLRTPILWDISSGCFWVSKTLPERTLKNEEHFIKDFFSKCDQIRSFLRIWSNLLKKPLMENFIFCAV